LSLVGGSFFLVCWNWIVEAVVLTSRLIAQSYARCRDKYTDQLIEYAGMVERSCGVVQGNRNATRARCFQKILKHRLETPTSIVRFVRDLSIHAPVPAIDKLDSIFSSTTTEHSVHITRTHTSHG
jgi:hypothetical protein